MTDIRDRDDGSCCSSSASTVKISNFTVPRDSPVLLLMFGWLSTPSLIYYLNKFKLALNTTEFYVALEPFIRHATDASHFDEADCVLAVNKFFKEHEADYITEYLKHRAAAENNDDNRKPPAKRSRGNDEHVAAAPGVRSVAAAAASVNEGTAAPVNDSAPATGSAPGVVEVVVKPGDAANAPFHDASSLSVSVKTPSPHSRTLDIAAVPIELGGATSSPSDDSSNLHGRATGVDSEQVVEHGRAMSVDTEQVAEHGWAMSVDAEQVVKHGGATGSTSEDSSKLRGSDMSVDAQDRMLP